jgi:hypothetical protein
MIFRLITEKASVIEIDTDKVEEVSFGVDGVKYTVSIKTESDGENL